MRPGAGYINMNIAVDGTRVSAVRAFLRPALSRPNLAAAQYQRGETELQRYSLRGRQSNNRRRREGYRGPQGSDPGRGLHP